MNAKGNVVLRILSIHYPIPKARGENVDIENAILCDWSEAARHDLNWICWIDDFVHFLFP